MQGERIVEKEATCKSNASCKSDVKVVLFETGIWKERQKEKNISF